MISIKENSRMCSLHQNLGCPLITLCLTVKAKSPHSSFSHYCAYPANTFVYHTINKIGKPMRLHKNSAPEAQQVHTETTAWTQAVLVARILSPFQHRDTSAQATRPFIFKPYSNLSSQIPLHAHTEFHKEPSKHTLSALTEQSWYSPALQSSWINQHFPALTAHFPNKCNAVLKADNKFSFPEV